MVDLVDWLIRLIELIELMVDRMNSPLGPFIEQHVVRIRLEVCGVRLSKVSGFRCQAECRSVRKSAFVCEDSIIQC